MERALEAKVLPPRLPDTSVPRPRLAPLLDEITGRRLTSVVAPSGFGKSTLLACWAEQRECAWYTCGTADRDLDAFFQGLVSALRLRVSGIAEVVRQLIPGTELGPDAGPEEASRAAAYAARLCGVLQDQLDADLVLVLDDLHELPPGSGAAGLVAAMARQAPRRLHLVALSRDEPPFLTARLRAQGAAAELDGALLAFDAEEIRALVARVLTDGPPKPSLVEELYAVTRGWPAAVSLALDAVRVGARLPSAPAAVEPDRLIGLLAEEILPSLGPAALELVERVSPLEVFSEDLCATLGVAQPTATLDTLQRRGLAHPVPDPSASRYALHPLIRSWARARQTDPDRRRHTEQVAAGWLLANGDVRDGLWLLARADDPSALAEHVTRHGPALLADGDADDVLALLQLIDPDGADDETCAALTQIEGEARHVTGDWEGALAAFGRLREPQGLPAGAAWRKVFIHHQQGDLQAALSAGSACDRASGEPFDLAMLDALIAATHWMRGEFDECRRLAERAHETASGLGADRALAASHTALAMLAAVTGDRRTNDAHYLRALLHAERAGDVHQLTRIHNNRGSRYLEEGLYPQALAELDLAIDQADLAGFATMRALALTNRGQVLWRTGQPDEALRDLTTASVHFERVGAHMLAYPLTQIGEIHAARGEVALARAAFEEADRIAAGSGDVQARVPALAGLARLLAETEPGPALEAADRAVSLGPTLGHPAALLARGWVALRAGDPDWAEECATAAASAARAHRDRAGLAGAVELSAAASRDPDRTARLLREAAASWAALGQELDAARVRTRLAAETAASAEERDEAEEALAALRAAGITRDIPPSAPATPDDVAVAQVLGGFRLHVGGRSVATGDWGSRKPRDLLKLLIAHQGPVRREAVTEALWPGEAPDRTGRRLSVALSTLRSVLDPERAYAADHFVVADREALWLDPEHWEIDLVRLVGTAETALRLVETGGEDGVRALLRVEEAMGGEAFEEDAYADWAQPARDQVRTLTIHSLRALAEVAERSGSPDRATRLLLRLLQRDPYDEPAHRQLVEVLLRAGRHGEARRMYRAYCERMAELDVEPAPYPESGAPNLT